jgi:two-component system, cell cycle response regulator DivK
MTNKRILVVDDQEDLRGVLRDLLTGSGYVVLESADMQAAIAMARAEHPDVILMDIQMPVLDGYEATRQIKADPTLAKTPIIVVSSFAMKGDEEKARPRGAITTSPNPTARCNSCAPSAGCSASKDRVFLSAL